MKDSLFYSIAVSFFVGIFVCSYISPGSRGIGIALIILVSFILKLWIKRHLTLLVILICATISLLVGALRIELTKTAFHELDSQAGKKISLVGVICDEPVAKEMSFQFCFEPEQSRDRILVRAERYPEYMYGDKISIEGLLELPENFESYPGGPVFNYVAYLAKDQIRYIVSSPQIEKLGEGEGSRLLSALYSFKQGIIYKSERLISEPASSLLGGILLGDKSSLPKDVTEHFRIAGLMHILVLSGYNVNIIVDSLMKALSFLPRLYGSILGGVSIILFALMTGASETTIRASIMAFIVLSSRLIGRRYNVLRALTAAAFIMVLENPYILAFDISFELSFLATIGIVYVSPIVSQRLGFVTERFNLREMCATTIGTQIFVTPFILYTMGQFSVVSLLSNILILPFIPYSMLSGFFSILFGFISEILALPLGWATQAILSYVMFVAKFTASLPFASLQIHISSGVLMCTYAVFCFYLIRVSRLRNVPEQFPN